MGKYTITITTDGKTTFVEWGDLTERVKNCDYGSFREAAQAALRSVFHALDRDVVCVESNNPSRWTAGKVYHIDGGIIKDNRRIPFETKNPITSVEALNKLLAGEAKFINFYGIFHR